MPHLNSRISIIRNSVQLSIKARFHPLLQAHITKISLVSTPFQKLLFLLPIFQNPQLSAWRPETPLIISLALGKIVLFSGIYLGKFFFFSLYPEKLPICCPKSGKFPAIHFTFAAYICIFLHSLSIQPIFQGSYFQELLNP